MLKVGSPYTRTFTMRDAVNRFSKKTGATVSVMISKSGEEFKPAEGIVTEMSNGFYRIDLTAADTDTLGDLVFHCTAPGAADTDFVDQVVAFDMFGGARLVFEPRPNGSTQNVL